MRCTFPILFGLGIAVLPAAGQSTPSSFALVGVRVEIGDGRVLDRATVILRDGLIVAVGPNVVAPADAEVIQGAGLTVYPGFTFPAPQPDQDSPPDTTAFAPASMRVANRKGIRPEVRTADYLTLTDGALAPIRQAGFTTALIAPLGGTISGVGSLVNLSGAPTRDAVVRSNVFMGFGFGGGPGGFRMRFDPAAPRPAGTGYPGNLLGYIALLRQTLLDAQYYRTVSSAFARGASRRPPADAGLQALQPVLDGTLPAVFDADTENQIVRSMNIADEFGLRLVVSGGGEAWKLAPKLAERKIPVLVSLNFGDEPGVAKAPPAASGGATGGRPGGRPGGPRIGVGAPGVPPPPNGAAPPPAAPPAFAPPPKPGAPQSPPPVATPAGTGTPPPNGPLPPSANVTVSPDDEDETPKPVIAEQHRKWEEKVANAARLQQAGVPLVFTTRGVRTPADFMEALRKAIKAGLSRENALQALTRNAARMFGVDRQMGTVEAGKIAALVVMNGDFVDPKTKVRFLFIDKTKFDLEKDRASTPPAFPGRGAGGDDNR